MNNLFGYCRGLLKSWLSEFTVILALIFLLLVALLFIAGTIFNEQRALLAKIKAERPDKPYAATLLVEGGHHYLIFTDQWLDKYVGIVHAPDCPCHETKN